MAINTTRVCRRHILAGLGVLLLLQSARQAAIAAPQSFLIFFDKHASILTTPAKQLVARVKDLIKPSSRVTITGHCDTSESEPDKLSLARAMEIQKELVTSGIPAGATLIVSGKGTSQPRTVTGPNVSDVTNRNAAITIE